MLGLWWWWWCGVWRSCGIEIAGGVGRLGRRRGRGRRGRGPRCWSRHVSSFKNEGRNVASEG